MIIVLGSRKKYESLYRYLLDKNLEFKFFEAEPNNANASTIIDDTAYIGYSSFFNYEYYTNFPVTKVINFRDQKKWIDLENKIASHFSLPQVIDNKTLKFYTFKSEQDKVCKNLGIPTIGNKSDKIIVKLDAGYSGGTDFIITNKNDYRHTENSFIQSYIDIDYTLAIHVFADKEGNLFPYCFHKIIYENNCPRKSLSPVFDDECLLLIKYLKKLKTSINIKDRLIFWQFVKDKNGNLYNMDFNCRPAGGFENGSYDRDIANHNILDYFLDNKTIPKKIFFKKQVELNYNKDKTFGYSEYIRSVSDIKEINYDILQLSV